MMYPKTTAILSLILLTGLIMPTEAQVSRLDKRFNMKPKSAAKPTTKTTTRTSATSKTATIQKNSPEPSRQVSPYVTLSGLYNEEEVELPTWLLDEVKDLNDQLKAKLSPSDYLEILKGESYLFGGYKTKVEYQRQIQKNPPREYDYLATIQQLREKLKAILDNPDDDNVFTRPHFVKRQKKGVIFREYIRYCSDYITFADKQYILGRKPGLSIGDSSLWTFWDTRTGYIKTKFACQSNIVGMGKRLLVRPFFGENIYLFTHCPSEGGSEDWSGNGARNYLINPYQEDYQAYNFDEFYTPTNAGKEIKGGILYRQASPLPMYEASKESVDDENPPKAPWKLSEDTMVEYFHKPQTREELGCVWGNGTSHHEINLALDDLSINICQRLNNNAEELKVLEKTIREAMFPAPSSAYGDTLLHYLDIGEEENGYVVFVRFSMYYDDGSSGFAYMFGILTPDKKTYFFSRPQESDWESGLPHSGYLKPYDEVVKPMRISKSMEHDFVQKYPGCPYIIVGDKDVSLMNIPDEYLTPLNSYGPKMRTMETYLSEDKRRLELFVVANLSKNNEAIYIIHLNLDDYSYVVKKEWNLYRNHSLKPIWISNKKILMKPVSDFQYSIIQVEDDWSEHKLADLYIESPQKYAIVLPDGRYAGAPGCESILEFGDGERVIGMKALAPWRNRPAEVLEALGGNPDDIAALRETTKRWLRKQGFDPDNMPAEPALSHFPVAEVAMPDLFSPGERLSFQVKLKATAHGINKMLVYADGVLIPQSWESALDIAAGEEREVTVEVPLASGQNWIEITPIDSEGISGDTTRFRTIYEGNYPSDLFIVALGVSDYDDPDLKLQYAAKDAKDIAAAFEKYGTGRKHVLVLTDKEVRDRSVLEKVKIFLSTASLEDRIVFYVAGHGMLDDKLNYYYAPAGFDAERIVETGIPMEELTACLRDSQARHRLLLLDTCHSGVLGEEGEDKLALAGVQLPHGVRAIQNRGMKVKKAVGALNANQKKRYIEDMFSQGDTERGINIIAGAAGAEFALESDSWNNGVFTASVISALRGEGGITDLDGDGFFSVEELQQRVSAAVHQQTGGRQKPSIVSAEGAENMVIAEGVGYYAFKQLIMSHDWDGVIKLIKRNPKVSDTGQAEELMITAIEQHAPLHILKYMLDAEWVNNQNYARSLYFAIDYHDHADGRYKRCTHYDSEKLAIAKAFVEKGMKGVPLHHYEDNDLELVQLMLENGADATRFNDPFAEKHPIEMYHLFVKYGADVNKPLTIGEKEREAGAEFILSVIQKRIERAANLKPADKQRLIKKSKEFLSDRFIPVTPLWNLAFNFCYDQQRRGEILEKMKILLENGGNPNEKQIYESFLGYASSETTPLHVLCRSGKISFTQALPAIKLLIKHGADIHLKDFNLNEPLDSSDPNYPVLMQMAEAARMGMSLDRFDSQIRDIAPVQPSYTSAGGDRSGLDSMIANMSALRCREAASQLYQKRLLTLLPMIRNGADVDLTLPETKGNTALHYAVAIGSWSITQWLVEHGANVNAVTNAGKTPLDCVGSDNAKRIRELLISRGARKSR